jgi:hypothetical protein
MPAIRTRFVSFTFGRDAELTLILVVYLKFLGVAPKDIIIIDDVDNPFTAAEAEAIKAEGAIYKFSNWKRGGNLNGKAAVQGVLTDLVAHSKDVDRVVKIDVDTLPTQAFFKALEKHADVDLIACGGGRPAAPIMGACYALTPAAAERLQFASAFLAADGRYPEDVTVGSLAMEWGLKIKTCPLGYQDYHNPGMYFKNMPSWAVCFGFITDTVNKPKRTKEIYAKFVASKMRKFIALTSETRVKGTLDHSILPLSDA